MKKIIYLTTFLFFNMLNAQQDCIEDVDLQNNPTPCCNPVISTGFPNPTNTDYAALLNQFDWLAPTATLPNPNILDINYGGNQVQAEHPFLSDLTKYSWYSNYSIGPVFNIDTHNMHPKYGWELLHSNFGLGLYNTATPQQTAGRFNPYMLFYNKYEGKLRAFFSPGAGNTFDETTVDLQIPYLKNDPTRNLSALFNHYNRKSKALDKETEINLVSAHLPFATPSSWSATDFQLAYDPCVCNHESRMQFTFTERNFSNVEMVGRIVGTNVPLNTSGNSPLNFGDDFLTSVWAEEDFTSAKAQTGMLVYNQIADDVESAYVSKDMKVLGKLLDLVSSASFIKGIKLPLPQGIKDGFPKLADKKIPVGSAITSLTKFASKKTTPGASNITYLEAEGAFNGLITDESSSGGLADIELLQPGSYHPSRFNVPWTQHTFYNEAPGLFAVLETPEVEFVTKRNDNQNLLSQWYFSLKDPIKYTFNPAAEINLNETELYAQIEFVLYQDESLLPGGCCPTDPELGFLIAPVNAPFDFQNAVDVLAPSFYFSEVNADGKRVVQTDLLPIDKLNEYVFSFEENQISFLQPNAERPIDIRINIIADYTFLANKYGEVYNTVQVYSYDVDDIDFTPSGNVEFSCNSSSAAFCNKINHREIASDYVQDVTISTNNFTQDTTIYANNVTISGNISSSNGAMVNIYAANEINFVDGSISPEVNLEIKDIFEHEGLNPVSDLFVKNFCNSNNYKANEAVANKIAYAKNETKEKREVNTYFDFSINPNPFENNLSLSFELDKDASVSANLYNLQGQTIKNYFINQKYQTGIHNLNLDNSQKISEGIYIFELCINGECNNLKLIKK